MREVRRRIKSIKNTQQITRAMHMIAAAKIKKVRKQLEDSRHYYKAMNSLFKKLLQQTKKREWKEGDFEKKETKTTGVVVITGNRGLAGGFNHNVVNTAIAFIKEKQPHVKIISIGAKGSSYLKRKGYVIEREFIHIGDNILQEDVRKISEEILKAYREGVFDEIYLIYTEFINTIKQSPRILKLLPVEDGDGTKGDGKHDKYLFEPSTQVLVNMLIPRYLFSQLFGAQLESKTSELAARMTAMDSATENAQELIEELTLAYNRARQAMITKEISEIVGGAEALTRV